MDFVLRTIARDRVAQGLAVDAGQGHEGGFVRTMKRRMREAVADKRSRLSTTRRAAAAADLAGWMSRAPFPLEDGVVAGAYIPFGNEPGSRQFLDALLDRGVQVLVPVVPPGQPQKLNWVRYDATTTIEHTKWGLLEPTGERLGVDAIATASVIFVPALAVDRTGARLGRGAGYYDRTLGGLTAELVAVVYDDEVVGAVPAGEYDIPVGWALTPGHGYERLG